MVRLTEARGNHLEHEEFLELLVADELAVRASRLVERRVRAAMFRESKSLDEFDFAFNPSIKRKQVFDDMGMKQLPGRSGGYLLEIILRRHENRSTMMTSNRPLEDWAKLIGDVPSATAILDRFLQHATIINITGKSYRLKNRSKADQEGRRSTADGERLSPPEDTAPVTAVSSVAGVIA